MDKKDYREAMDLVTEMRDDLEELVKEFSNYYWQANHSDKADALNALLEKVNNLDRIIFNNKPNKI